MASQLIAHVAAWYIPTGQPLVNDMDGLTIDGAYRLEAQRMHAELERRARGQPLCVEIDIRPVKNKRTLDQNRLMWALLNRLALALSGDTPGGVTAEQCYLDLLAEFGAEVETWRVPVKALPALRNTYRVVQMVELLDNGYCMARLGMGSSSFTRQQMHDFIERIFDRLSEAAWTMPRQPSNTETGGVPMDCIKCNSSQVRVIDTRAKGTWRIYRRRVCMMCGFRWTTVELPVGDVRQAVDAVNGLEERRGKKHTAKR